MNYPRFWRHQPKIRLRPPPTTYVHITLFVFRDTAANYVSCKKQVAADLGLRSHLNAFLAGWSDYGASAGTGPRRHNATPPRKKPHGTRPGTMAAGAREQAASCDAFVLSRRPPAPDAPLKRGISFAKTRRFRAADYSPRPAPRPWNIRGAWNIAVRTRGVFTHRTGFLKPACAERGLVRTGRPRQTHTIQKTALWRTQGT